MKAKSFLFSCLFLIMSLSLINAQTYKKLLGAWKTTIDYETYTLEFISKSQLILNGETHSCTLTDSNIVADYQHYPYTFRGENLFITADGYEHKFTRTGEANEKTSVAEALTGSWENKGDYEMHKVTFHSDSQLEYDGEWVGYTIEDNAIIVDYEKYLIKMEGEALMVKWPGETEYRKYTRIED